MITLKDALKLIEWLPGETAKKYRGKVVEIFTCYLAGDASMHSELEANAAPMHHGVTPICVLSRGFNVAGHSAHRMSSELPGWEQVLLAVHV